MVRKNGFQCPWHYCQILVVLIIALNIAIFYGICFVTMSVSLSFGTYLIIGTIYAVLTFITISYYLATSCSNPTDPTIMLEKVCNYNELSFHSSNYEYYCNVCSSCVL